MKWQKKFENLLNEYSSLSAEHNQLKLSNERLKKYCKFLEEENLQLRQVINSYKSEKFELRETRSLKTEFKKRSVRCLSLKQTPQPTPDNGAESERSSNIFEAFFVIGISHSSLDDKPEESILFEYPAQNAISKAMKNVIPTLALPKREVERLKLTESGTQINNLIFGQIPVKRNENFFIFTLRNEKIDLSQESDLPNSNHEVVYFICLVVEDIAEKNGVEYITSKSYCIASFVPVFELHFDALCSVLILKRLYRMDVIQNIDLSENAQKLSNLNITEEAISFLQDLSKVNYLSDTVIKTRSLENLKYSIPRDWHFTDIPFLCIPLFSVLPVQDLCFLVASLLQEKSIIFVSSNLGLVTSAVLGLRALTRPLAWLNLIVPLIPDNLRELIEAPVPILAGIPNIEQSIMKQYSNIIWVLLDDPHKIPNKSHYQVTLLNETLISQISKVYSFNNNMFDRSPELDEQANKVAGILYNYWMHILGKFNGVNIRQKGYVQKVIQKFPDCEQVFVSSLINTQLFANSIDC